VLPPHDSTWSLAESGYPRDATLVVVERA